MEDELGLLEAVEDSAITDPLSEVTRRERKLLLSASLVSVALAKGGLVPQRIEALGVELSGAEIKSLLYLLASVLVYLLAGFGIYAASDLKRRNLKVAKGKNQSRPILEAAMKKAKEEALQSSKAGSRKPFETESLSALASVADKSKMAAGVMSVSRVRVAFDVYLPIGIGLSSFALVMNETAGFPGWQRFLAILLPILFTTAVGLAWRSRKKLKRWFGVRGHRLRQRKFKRHMGRLQALPKGSRERTELEALTKSLFERSLKGPWV